MIEKLNLGGFIISSTGDRNQLSVIENPTDQEVCTYLELVASGRGFLSLWKGEEDEPGECSLNLFCDGGQCYAECSEITSDGDRVVYRTHDPEKPAKDVAILGQFYNAQSLTSTSDVVRQFFLLYLATGGKIPPSFSALN